MYILWFACWKNCNVPLCGHVSDIWDLLYIPSGCLAHFPCKSLNRMHESVGISCTGLVHLSCKTGLGAGGSCWTRGGWGSAAEDCITRAHLYRRRSLEQHGVFPGPDSSSLWKAQGAVNSWWAFHLVQLRIVFWCIFVNWCPTWGQNPLQDASYFLHVGKVFFKKFT